ncbi:hypothetical protein ELS19_16270 [Halogeometricum borinquense]|uniref:Uncharacterized protein n=1 Tax=Halogeometricum borinquense TaxID=60847 RepID=A0A482T278_9EURY|nr:hypothetical protein [Halogeometricum borinquense]RYJ08132.1 hypothetical protein ELS19_16270 [Halogeometricum borinquense]
MTVYRACPYCDEVFQIGSEEDNPLVDHIREFHTVTEDAPLTSFSQDELQRRLHEASTVEETKALMLAILYKRHIPVRTLSIRFGIPEEMIRGWFDRLASGWDSKSKNTQ